MAKITTKQIQTRLGLREVQLDSIIYFPRGLVGMEDKRDFALFPLKDEESPFFLLQCTTDPELGLLVADPYAFLEDYDLKLEKMDKRTLKVERREQIGVLVTVTIPPNCPKDTTLNLHGPIVLNTEERLGIQVPQTDSLSPSHFRINGMNKE